MTPDFIIGGAPKCGTTSLHQVLDQHPDLWVAKNEVYFYDADDPIAHGDFLSVENGQLKWRDPKDPAFQVWYANRFADAPKGALVGEDTTTYLMSEVAAARIKTAAPDTKMIFMLRDPVKRAVSQYWHLLRSGRTWLSFEEALSTERSIIQGSTYAPSLRRYLDLFGSAQVHVVLFEAFKSDMQATVTGVTDYLGAAPLDVATVETWHNKTKYPSHARTLRRANRVGRPLVAYRYAGHFGGDAPLKARLAHRGYRRWHRYVTNRILIEDTPPDVVQPRTLDYLTRHLSDRNTGLSEMLGKDLSTLWPGFTG
ncbi:MAG: sulfotransferase [Pseudomonadota bacterium]